MSQQYLELIVLLLVLSVIFYVIFTLYKKSQMLLSKSRVLTKENQELKELKLHLQSKNSHLIEKLERFDELQDIEHKYHELLGKQTPLQEQLHSFKVQLQEANTQIEELLSYKQRSINLEELLEKQKSTFSQIQEQMKKDFKLLSSEVLQQKQEHLQKSSKEHLQQLLKPFESELKNFKGRLEQLHNNQYQSLATLRGEILQIKSLNQTLANEANALTKALKGDKKLQGNWGELILEKALESCGLREGKEYKREAVFKGQEGSLRADVVLFLPEDKHIVIDAKVSLNAYSQMVQASSKEELESAKKAHIISIKKHIDTLASKQYHMLNELRAPEFTLMFIPIEAAYIAAVDTDANLFEYAFERKVAVVTPTTLLTTLKTVSTLWKLANHDKNMQKLANEAALMHDKFALFLEEFNAIEQRLFQAQSAYDNAKQRLISGRGSLFGKIKKVGELSSKTKKSLPPLESDIISDREK